MSDKQYPRPCSVTSHQFYLEGWCLGIANRNGKILAIIESKSGDVGVFDLTSIYTIKFSDREPES